MQACVTWLTQNMHAFGCMCTRGTTWCSNTTYVHSHTGQYHDQLLTMTTQVQCCNSAVDKLQNSFLQHKDTQTYSPSLQLATSLTVNTAHERAEYPPPWSSSNNGPLSPFSYTLKLFKTKSRYITHLLCILHIYNITAVQGSFADYVVGGCKIQGIYMYSVQVITKKPSWVWN